MHQIGNFGNSFVSSGRAINAFEPADAKGRPEIDELSLVGDVVAVDGDPFAGRDRAAITLASW